MSNSGLKHSHCMQNENICIKFGKVGNAITIILIQRSLPQTVRLTAETQNVQMYTDVFVSIWSPPKEVLATPHRKMTSAEIIKDNYTDSNSNPLWMDLFKQLLNKQNKHFLWYIFHLQASRPALTVHGVIMLTAVRSHPPKLLIRNMSFIIKVWWKTSRDNMALNYLLF